MDGRNVESASIEDGFIQAGAEEGFFAYERSGKKQRSDITNVNERFRSVGLGNERE